MSELQFWHWIATGALGVLLTILAWVAKKVWDKAEAAVPKDDFKIFLEKVEIARRENRETIIQLFEDQKENAAQQNERFAQIIKDFNGGMQRITEDLSDTKYELLRELNKKEDR